MGKLYTTEITAGSKITIPVGTKIKTVDGEIKADRSFQVTASKVEWTKAGNPKVTWRGHRSVKTAIVKILV